MALRVYNTLTRQKEAFPKTPPAEVGMYVCGPTVYKPSHIGHMVGPVIFDTVKRYLTYLGFEVNWVVNITDVDDKLIVRSREIGTTVKDLAEKMTADYVDCLCRLNVTGIDRMPRATEHIAEMIEIMRGLIAKGYGYAAGGDVYFDVTKDPDYGKLCNRDPEQMEAGSRIEVSDRKRNPGDFAMWKGSKPGEPAWESPWGPGRPGWHIECSAMSMKYLGKTLDIHGGGLDLQFPHHENELAQSESYTGSAVRAGVDAQRPAEDGHREDGRLRRQRRQHRRPVAAASCGDGALSCCSARITAARLSTARSARRDPAQPRRLLPPVRALSAHHRRQLLQSHRPSA